MRVSSCYTCLFLFMFFTIGLRAQVKEKLVESSIEQTILGNQIVFTAIAENKTMIIQSIHYKLSVIKNDVNSGNRSKNEQSGAKVLQAYEKLELSKTGINVDTKDRIIVLLLVYDVNENLISTSRVVLNDTKSEDKIKEEFNSILESASTKEDSEVGFDGIKLSGIVIDECKTKAGRDFYQLFYSSYLSRGIEGDKVIKIVETLTLGSNTKIAVKVENDIVFEFFVRSQYDYIKSMADLAIQKVVFYFKSLKRETQLIKRY